MMISSTDLVGKPLKSVAPLDNSSHVLAEFQIGICASIRYVGSVEPFSLRASATEPP